MINKKDIDLASLFNDVKEPLYNDHFTKQVTRRINKARRTRLILKISLTVLGMIIFVEISPWLMKQTGFAMLMTDSLVQSITLVCLSPVGWILSSIMALYSLLKPS
jgi:hypothetical protein